MDCPICNYPGIDEKETTCPRCSSDLTVFKEIHSMNDDVKKARGKQRFLYIIMLLIVLGWAYTYFFAGTLSDNEIKSESEQKTQQIIELNREVARLKNLVSDDPVTSEYEPEEEITYNNPTAEAIRRRSLNNAKKLEQGSRSNETTSRTSNTRNTEQQNNTYTPSNPVQNNVGNSDVEYYTIKTGETLYSIAKKVYGNGNKYKKIMADNNINDHTDIKVGQKLKVYPN